MKINDKVVVAFYEDKTDSIIYSYLDTLTRRRNFANKIKDILLEYIKMTQPDIFERIEKDILDKDFKDNMSKVKKVKVNDKVKAIEKSLNNWDEE